MKNYNNTILTKAKANKKLRNIMNNYTKTFDINNSQTIL